MDEADQGSGGSPAQSVSFCGCGFILGYELGVIQALQELAPEMLGSAAKFFGISSGAIAAAVLACGGNQGKADEWFSLFGVLLYVISSSTSLRMVSAQTVDEVYYGVLEKNKKSLLSIFSSGYNFLKLLEKGLRKGLTENCHQLASGRLYIGLTRLPDGQKVVISDFCSKEEVIQAVLCSCFIPCLCGWIPPSFRGMRYIDGGFTSLHHLSDPETTIYVSPFAGENDICPRDCPAAFYTIKFLDCSFQISVENLCRISYSIFPPLCLNTREIYEQGYHDTVFYLQMNKEHGTVTRTSKKTSHKQLQHRLPDAQQNRNLSGLLHALAEIFLQSFWNYIKYLQKRQFSLQKPNKD
ncbi:PREDICTED: patatin-like phospholipase domain-containing protein 1 [Gavialis gangeticus]|uniref:patatin-like phospholipase domain-containing protein 1 n=1 Tax=Gavialis gangeticus TaxID=94835 RepID=UPI00092F2D21|nr:PREDICTED: patatin-like phospholipase domain-containing protein 1 [Gavialis gangeticus]